VELSLKILRILPELYWILVSEATASSEAGKQALLCLAVPKACFPASLEAGHSKAQHQAHKCVNYILMQTYVPCFASAYNIMRCKGTGGSCQRSSPLPLASKAALRVGKGINFDNVNRK